MLFVAGMDKFLVPICYVLLGLEVWLEVKEGSYWEGLAGFGTLSKRVLFEVNGLFIIQISNILVLYYVINMI